MTDKLLTEEEKRKIIFPYKCFLSDHGDECDLDAALICVVDGAIEAAEPIIRADTAREIGLWLDYVFEIAKTGLANCDPDSREEYHHRIVIVLYSAQEQYFNKGICPPCA